tara:strand:+ start:53 stop:547 length:495 start_codon:yes stop_codon:yes gene_type:complete
LPEESGVDMKIKLNECEQKLAKHLAVSRNKNARSKGKPNTKMGNQSDEETDLEGIAGELVVCKALNLYPDTEIDLVDLPKFDLLTAKGNTVDVKTTKYLSGRMLATMKKRVEDCNIYVLVVGTFPSYRIAGWCKAEELLKKENIINLGHGEGYALSQEQLRTFK